MQWLVDVVALIIIVLCVIFGIKDGFAKTFISTFSTILSLVFAFLLCSKTAEFLQYKFQWVTKIGEQLKNPLSNVFGADVLNTPVSEVNNTLSISAFLAGIIANALSNGAVPPETTVGEVICPIFGYYIVVLISIIIMFALFKLLFFVIGQIINKATKIKIIKWIDKTLGAFLGIIRAIVIIDLLIIVIRIIPVAFFQNLIILIEQSTLTSFLNTINVFGLIIKIIASPIAFI